MQQKVLRLDKAGHPMSWLPVEQAASLYVKQQVLWNLGDNHFRLHGGVSRLSGKQSVLHIAPIIAVDGAVHPQVERVPRLSNAALFARDKNTCLYCGGRFATGLLTRDHVIPRGQGGEDSWMNCVTACRACNQRKGCRTPEQAKMPLIAVPFKPNKFEYLALANRNILSDQMDYLSKGFARYSA
jgi:5-methylcytosine-specific restriction endonuclease McrA